MNIAVLTSWFLAFQYPIIYVLAIVEGPVIMMLSGLLVKLGYANFWPIYFLLMAGDLTADTLWYWLGRNYAHALARRFGKYIGLTEELLDRNAKIFERHSSKILVLSKVTMSFGFAIAVLVAAGMAKVPFKKYITFNGIGQFFWTAFLMGIGYFFANFIDTINKDFRIGATIGFFAFVFLAMRGAAKYLRSRDLASRL